MARHPFGCEPNEPVVLAYSGAVCARDAVREAMSPAYQNNWHPVILRAADKVPAVLGKAEIERLAKSKDFL